MDTVKKILLHVSFFFAILLQCENYPIMLMGLQDRIFQVLSLAFVTQ